MSVAIDDQVFCLRGPDGRETWQAIVGGVVVDAEWPDRGSALAGLERRAALDRICALGRRNTGRP